MQAPGRGEGPARIGVRGGGSGLDERYFVPTAALCAAMAEAPRVDYERLRADLDAHADQDPTSRAWGEPRRR